MREIMIKIEGIVPHAIQILLKEDLTISGDLEREVNEGAAQYGYYAVMAEKAESRYQAIKLSFELWVSEKEKSLLESNPKKYKLAKDLTRDVMSDKRWKAFKLKMDEFSEQSKILKRVAEAFEKKVSLIQTANANRRAEYSLRDK